MHPMDTALREILGKAAHHAMSDFFRQRKQLNRAAMLTSDDLLWEKLDDDTKELYRVEAESVVNVYLSRQ